MSNGEFLTDKEEKYEDYLRRIVKTTYYLVKEEEEKEKRNNSSMKIVEESIEENNKQLEVIREELGKISEFMGYNSRNVSVNTKLEEFVDENMNTIEITACRIEKSIGKLNELINLLSKDKIIHNASLVSLKDTAESMQDALNFITRMMIKNIN